MEKRKLGNSGISVHPIGIGLWAMGGNQWGPTEDRESLSTIDRALELGIDFFDTADVYGDGHSEVLLGKAMKGRRDKFVLGTKIGWVDFDGDKGQSAYSTVEKVKEGVETNLKRLDTDYIDVLQWHVNFREPTMETFIEGSMKLKEEGKIRAFGVSSSDYPFIEAFFGNGEGDTLQIDYSILNRMAENEIFPFCRKKNVGTIIRGGLAMGLLTGKFSRDSEFAENDFRKSWKDDAEQREQFLKDLETVEKLKEAFPGENLAQLALRFTISHRDVSVVIPGAKRISQLESNFGAAEKGLLSKDEQALIDSIVNPGGGRRIWPA
ncbi:MAG: aldo/keto reductase [Spirochaetales bacterium]|nr:aldo/keto reductase [Spirochaetales bacterium]